MVTWHQARVHLDAHIVFDKRLYSVPWRLVGQQVWVRASASSIVIFAEDVRVAMHDRRGSSMRSTHEEHLPEERAPWRHRSRAYWEERAARIAPEVGECISAVFDSDDVFSTLRIVQSMVNHLEKFPVERGDRGMPARALLRQLPLQHDQARARVVAASSLSSPASPRHAPLWRSSRRR